MKIVKPEGVEKLEEIIRSEEAERQKVRELVREIVDRVRKEGDKALTEYTRKFDRWEGEPLKCDPKILRDSWESLEEREKKAILTAKERIEKFHINQLEKSWFVEDRGSIIGTIVNPVDRVGLYIPGGTTSLPSTVLMTAIPAVVAGVREIIATTPTPKGYKNKYTLATLYICGINEVFFVGGAQAISAMAYGTESIPKVDVIAGPGNIFVSEAKALVYGDVGIDSIAGPSEIMVIADETYPPKWIAMDLLSQAEHDVMARSILVTNSEKVIEETLFYIEEFLKTLPTREIAQESWEKMGIVIKIEDMKEAVEVVNTIAPEHLEVMTEDPWKLLPHIKNAGAIFLGGYSPEAMGDYIVGCNHTLPTGGRAKFSSPLGVYNFLKRSSIIDLSKDLFLELSEKAMILAEIEGLIAHRDSIKLRLEGEG
ncbi:MAG: histidinol dehydrogenase [Thermosulfidibacteraceae bacterium]|jgi:histidinol dehydrogenase